MRAVDLIRKKRDGYRLDPGEISWMVEGISSGHVADYQWSALLMAILWRGMDDSETSSLTEAMMRSGSILDLSDIPGPKIDKHSTGGVGDKTSLILAPIAAACGIVVPMVSGRGLGHTGGTLDKLESIPGFRVDLPIGEARRVLQRCGLVMIGQTAEIAPADKRLYALRDASATVESIPLISASIMSKKLAEGIDGLVLDVKTGNGAFMQTLDDSRALAHSMCAIGRDLGKKMVAVITRMDQPLGKAVGNALEVAECVEVLRGYGPPDLIELSVELAAEMVLMGKVASTLEDARTMCQRAIDDGSALRKFQDVVEAQGGDPLAIDDLSRLPKSQNGYEVRASRDGFVRGLEARPIGIASMILGAGRARVDSLINHAVGVVLHKKVGDEVVRDETLFTIYHDDSGPAFSQARRMIESAFVIGDVAALPPPNLVERIEA